MTKETPQEDHLTSWMLTRVVLKSSPKDKGKGKPILQAARREHTLGLARPFQGRVGIDCPGVSDWLMCRLCAAMLVAKLSHFWTSVSPSLSGLCKARHLGNVTLCSALPSPTTALSPLPAPYPIGTLGPGCGVML